MPRVLTKTKNRAGAERACGTCRHVIQPGEKYLSWSFRYGGTHYRCTQHPPRPSELTQSLMGGVYAAVESAQDELPTAPEAEAIRALVESVAESVAEVIEQYREAAEPFGGQGENAERADELEGWQSDLEGFDPDEPDEDTPDDEREDMIEGARAEADELLNGCPL